MVRSVLLFSVLSVFAVHGFADEQAAIAKIHELGGTVRSVAANDDSKDVDFHLSGTELTDEGLNQVAQLKNVVWLNLKDTAITDAGLKYLAGLTGLKKLHLERTAVSDAGLAHLKGLNDLEYLNLYGTKVTDAGVDHLASLKNLKHLYLWKSKVTEDGAEKLRKSLPDLDVNLGADLKPVVVEPIEDSTPKDPAPTKTLAKGQFIRVRLEGTGRTLALAEVQVVETGSGKPLHMDKKASQSSEEYQGTADRAIDGNTAQLFSENSTTHTVTEDYPWWLVDLGAESDIGRIKIWNRSDCCGNRLTDAVIEILSPEKNVIWSGRVEDAKDGSIHKFEQS
ncbi:MAG: discoidin domain-containing protein [Planctomycetales bacterium]